MDILITGGSGRLGTAIQRELCSGVIVPDAVAPDKEELNILDYYSCYQSIKKYKPRIVIHCAALVDTTMAETNRKECYDLNVIGTRNMVRACAGIRFIYVSTDYIFDGDNGDYTEEDTPNPINYYGLTKLIGEHIVLEHKKTLVIRTTFKTNPFPHKKAFIDQYTSAELVGKRAKDIIALAYSKLTGIINVGGEKMSMYDFVKQYQDIEPISLSDIRDVKIPRDVSLNTTKWKTFLKTYRQ